MLADVKLQTLDSIMTKHKPQLQRTETSAQGDLPVTVINHSARLCGFIAQVFRKHAQRLDQRLAVGDIEAITIKVREHPFMRIEAVAVRVFKPIINMPE